MIRTFASLLFLLIFLYTEQTPAQTARVAGLRENTPGIFVLTNANIVTEPGNLLRETSLVVRNGIIMALGHNVEIPADATVIDLQGHMIYPGFIDMFATYGMTEYQSEGPAYWNPQIRSHISSTLLFNPDKEKAAELRNQGFVAVHTTPALGLLGGKTSVVSLGEKDAGQLIIRPDVAQHMAFRPSEALGSGYPTSAMGAIALIRQSFYDAEWYVDAHRTFNEYPALDRPETNKTLEAIALARQQSDPFVAEAENEQWFLRAAAIADEFGLPLWIRGSGHEYRRLEAIKNANLPIILPLDFPEIPDVSTPEQAINVSLEDLRHWYLAPENPAKLTNSGLTIALTAYGSEKSFLKNLKTAVERGLDKTEALAALTTTPATLLGIDNHYGTIAPGKSASFIITDDELFESNTRIREVWIDGQRFDMQAGQEEARGQWMISSGKDLEGAIIEISGNVRSLRGTISCNNQKTRLTRARYDGQRLHIIFTGDSVGLDGIYRLSANLSGDKLLGAGEQSTGEFFTWTASRTQPHSEDTDRPKQQLEPLELPVRYPSMEYGISHIPEPAEHVLIRNATIWTQGPDGIMENADLLVSSGRIAEVGYNISEPRRARVIDASGMHLTPGLIDPHIHASIAGGVNETGDAITSETRIADVMHGDNVWIYRLLAGGITSATLFHGSANPIGGQNAVIKMRWGQMPDALLIEDAAPGLKMALGENVKRMSTRYPSSRQGTEQIIKDAFQAALEYQIAWQDYNKQAGVMPSRRDLQLEPILEVIRGERGAHVHAYRQDEMLMMMRLAEEYGFTIASFEHTLEGYKIADELREHGAAAVVWTDWSSFKVEAYDGILQNARLLNEVGVHTSLHSDNTQLSTRMNWEAAKTMMTGVPEEEAMNFITLNPAKIMGIDHRVGSIEAGKDADFVLWNGHPMSTFTTAEQTWVDGIKYFDRNEDAREQESIKQERAIIINRILELSRQQSLQNAQERN